MRLQRRLYGIYTFCFLLFTVLMSFGSSLQSLSLRVTYGLVKKELTQEKLLKDSLTTNDLFTQ